MSTPTPSPIRPLERVVNVALVVVFAVGISAPALRMAWPGQGSTLAGEARTTTPFPAWGWDAETLNAFPDQVMAWINDHFGFRDALIGAYNRFRVFALRESPSPKVAVGSDGWLYFRGDPETGDANPIEDYTGRAPLTPYQLERLRWLFHDQHAWLAEQGIPYRLVLIPSKPQVHPEHLPARYARPGKVLWREQFLAYMKEHTEVPILDLTAVLRGGATERRVYCPNDSHWNDFGAYLGAREVARTLGQALPEMDFVEVAEPGGDLARMLGLVEAYTQPRVRVAANSPGLLLPRPLIEHERAPQVGGTGDSTQPTAHIYRDSASDYLLKYLTGCFDQVTWEWGQQGSRMVGIEEERPDLVLQIMLDRVLNVDLIYAPRIQDAMWGRRYEAARPLRSLSPPATDPRTRVEVYKGGWALSSPRPSVRIDLPAFEQTDALIPIVRLDIRPSANAVVWLEAELPRTVTGQRRVQTLGRKTMTPGSNVLTFPVLDPTLRSPVRLRLQGGADYHLLALEVRGYPRR